MLGAGGQKRISDEFIKNYVVGIPAIEKQKSISLFLDQKTEEIDALIARNEALLAALAQKRTAIITHAVTKGLDRSAKLKNSGIDWLGEIPAHWNTKQLKYLVSCVGGGTPDKSNPEYWGGEIPWVSPKDMKVKYLSLSEDNITELGAKESATSIVQPGSLLIVVRSGILRHTIPVGINTVPVSINQDIKALTVKQGVAVEYLYNFIQGMQSNLLSLWSKQGCTVESIEVPDMLNTIVLLPPIADQKAIVAHIDKETSKIDPVVLATEKLITELKEYRSALISNAVTGKIKVA